MNLPKYLEDNISSIATIPKRDVITRSLPSDMHPDLVDALRNMSVTYLYSHQVEAWDLIRKNKHCIISTGTSSGKTFCYLLPILQEYLDSARTKALFLYPTRALANDQIEKIKTFINHNRKNEGFNTLQKKVGIFYGDTNSNQRKYLRENANFILSNPDMLHVGILPHHTLWESFFRQLKFVVIDEVHIYRGIFGSHLANTIRRLKRIAGFYGSQPIFVFSSATIGNPIEFCENILEEPLTLIDNDGSFREEQQIIFYNPPILDKKLGIRAGVLSEAAKWIEYLDALAAHSIFFVRTRRSVELLVRMIETQTEIQNKVRGYRSGYLAKTRRAIEQGFRSGLTRCIVSTNALELGIDIGKVDFVGILGYPGSIASFKQQYGRAGRNERHGTCIFIASSHPVDQYLVRHPNFIFDQPNEKVFLDSNNPFILMNHLRCAAYELPFRKGDSYGKMGWEVLSVYLESLLGNQEIIISNQTTFWSSKTYPASLFSLRSIQANPILLVEDIPNAPTILGSIDKTSALWMVHPGAVYLHEGSSYYVRSLNLTESKAILQKEATPFYTEAITKNEIINLEPTAIYAKSQYDIGFGDIAIETEIYGYKKILWDNSEVVGVENLELPKTMLQTKCCFLKIHSDTIERLRIRNAWKSDPNYYGKDWESISNLIKIRDNYTCQFCDKRESEHTVQPFHIHHIIPFRTFLEITEANKLSNLITLCPECHKLAEQNSKIRTGLAGLAYIMHKLAALYLLCDEGDIGYMSDASNSKLDRDASIIFFDRHPGGIGLSSELHNEIPSLLKKSLEVIDNCSCDDGCPACVGPSGEFGLPGKADSKFLIQILTKE